MSVLVIGDVMLDRFEEGIVDRISPEAPIPILTNPRGFDVLGGAANTARNIVNLGLGATLLGLVGDDTVGRRCRELAHQGGLTDELVGVPGWRTVVKHRFLAGGQQVLRVDTEDPVPASVAATVAERIRETLEVGDAQPDLIVISDYDKGAITDDGARAITAAARRRGVPLVVDSKRLDPTVFRGCTIICPNLSESYRMTGEADPARAAAAIASRTDSAVLVTLGADGMALHQDGEVSYLSSRAQEVSDVTGAGDSVTAGLAVGIVEGRSVHDAAHFASEVAAVAVSRKGTHAVLRSELTEGRR